MREYISFFLFSYFYFQLSVYIVGVGTVAIKIDQVCVGSTLTLDLYSKKKEGKSSLKESIKLLFR